MQIFQEKFTALNEIPTITMDFKPDVFFLFVSPEFPNIQNFINELHKKFTNTLLIGCSTAGEILGNEVLDKTLVLTAVKFEKTTLKLVKADLEDAEMNSFKTGEKISKSLEQKDLRHIFVLSEGLEINGVELVNGLHHNLCKSISITGGLAASSPNFRNTFVIHNNEIASKKVVALGLYGKDLKVGFGSKGGWDSFGIERLVTKSEKNVLYELDGKPALDLYKSYLGDKAKDLPGSGILFPLSLRDKNESRPVVRTVRDINEVNKSVTFGGNIPEGAYVRLMKANVDRIINGAEESAIICRNSMENEQQLAILISCIGRRVVLKQLVEEEVEAVNEQLGEKITTTGFYSYGEIAPFDKFSACELHNQTMTITTFSE